MYIYIDVETMPCVYWKVSLRPHEIFSQIRQPTLKHEDKKFNPSSQNLVDTVSSKMFKRVCLCVHVRQQTLKGNNYLLVKILK